VSTLASTIGLGAMRARRLLADARTPAYFTVGERSLERDAHQAVFRRLHSLLRDGRVSYLDTAFRIHDSDVASERRALLRQPGTLTTQPLVEPISRYLARRHFDEGGNRASRRPALSPRGLGFTYAHAGPELPRSGFVQTPRLGH